VAEYVIHRIGPFDIPLVGPRHVRVYAPPRDPAAVSPVLYMFDGQNVFDDEPSFAGGWHLHKTVASLAKKHVRAPVIVGIDHGGAARIQELAPWPNDRGGGRTDALVTWITGALAPRIQAEFRVASDPREVGVGGSSLGGLAALYAHFRHPEHFGVVLSMSPSLFIGRGKIFEVVASAARPRASRIYLDAGGLEAGGALLRSAERLAGELRARGWEDGSFRFVVAKRGTHSEKAWRRRAPAAIAWLFDQKWNRKRKRPG
jgi:predicted alpha/beta superfamily hydrolase